jgi:uncharacterized membrane protein YgcG
MSNFLSVVLLSTLALFPGSSSIPDTGSVIDGAALFSSSEVTELNTQILDLANESNVIYAVETVESLDGQNLEIVAAQRANELGIGDADLDNGVFVFISRDDRVVRVEVGSGVSDSITDGEAKNVVDNTITPNFKNGKFYAGVSDGLAALNAAYVDDEPVVEAPAPVVISEEDGAKIGGIVFTVVGSLLGAGALGGLIAFLVKRRNRKREEVKIAAEAERKRVLQNKMDSIMGELIGSRGFRDLNGEDRLAFINSTIEFKAKDKAEEDTLRGLIEQQFIDELKRSYASLPHNYITTDIRDLLVSKSLNEVSRIVNADKDKGLKRYKADKAEQRRVEEERRREETKKKKEADALWSKLSKAERKKLADMSSSRRRTYAHELAASYGYRDTSVDYFMPMFVTYYLTSSVLSSYATPSYSSSSSSSYSSPSYSSDSFSSFGGGGGFDGGGSSGSW